MAAPPARAIVFDIEVVPDWDYLRDSPEGRVRFFEAEQAFEPPANLTDPTKIAAAHTEAWAKTRKSWTFNTLTAKVIAIAWADLWEGPVICEASDDERQVLEQFALGLKEQEAVLTGYNVRRFDVPFITTRASLHGIELPWWWPHDRDYRRIADIMDATQGGKCQEWLERFGLPLKTSDGASVEAMTLDQVHEYCENDVHVERLLAQRFAPNMPGLRATQPQHDYTEIPA